LDDETRKKGRSVNYEMRKEKRGVKTDVIKQWGRGNGSNTYWNIRKRKPVKEESQLDVRKEGRIECVKGRNVGLGTAEFGTQ